MFKIIEQINYWKQTAEDNLETAEILISNNKYIEGLFFCHLSIEKILKALVVKEIGNVPPKSHNLIYLHEMAKVSISEEQRSFMAVLMKYQLEGRYPEYYEPIPSFDIVKRYLNLTKELLLCLKKKL